MKRIVFTLSLLTTLTQAYAMPAIDARITEHHESSSPGVTLKITNTTPSAGLSDVLRHESLTNQDGIVSDAALNADEDTANANTPYTTQGFADVFIENQTNQTHTYTILSSLCTTDKQYGKCSSLTDTVRLTSGDWFDYRKTLSNTVSLRAGQDVNTFVVSIKRDHSSTVFYTIKRGKVEVTGS